MELEDGYLTIAAARTASMKNAANKASSFARNASAAAHPDLLYR